MIKRKVIVSLRTVKGRSLNYGSSRERGRIIKIIDFIQQDSRFSNCIYAKKLDDFKVINSIKLGIIYGLFLDAFKLGS